MVSLELSERSLRVIIGAYNSSQEAARHIPINPDVNSGEQSRCQIG